MSARPQHLQLVLQVSDPLYQSSSVGLSPLIGLPASLLHLPLIPALHLRWYSLKEVLSHLQSMHVVPLLSKWGFFWLLSKHLQSPDPWGPSGLSPALGMFLAVLPSVPPSLPVSEASFSPAAAMALCRWRQTAGSVTLAPACPDCQHVHFVQILGLALGVSTDHWALLRANHLDWWQQALCCRRDDFCILSLITIWYTIKRNPVTTHIRSSN